jgi:hypothetical protein
MRNVRSQTLGLGLFSGSCLRGDCIPVNLRATPYRIQKVSMGGRYGDIDLLTVSRPYKLALVNLDQSAQASVLHEWSDTGECLETPSPLRIGF